MADFTLDTSGVVLMPRGQHWDGVNWSDLDPFTQGYGEAAARELYERLISDICEGEPARLAHAERVAAEAVAFRNWSPEALALILRDCAAVRKQFSGVRLTAKHGPEFFASRQNGFRVGADVFHGSTLKADFPPLTVSLSDEGKVVLS